jgi:hypothetical protein
VQSEMIVHGVPTWPSRCSSVKLANRVPRHNQLLWSGGESCTRYAVHHLLLAGTQLKLAGNAEEGMAYYHEAVTICSSYAPAFYNIAVVYSEAGRAEVCQFASVRDCWA